MNNIPNTGIAASSAGMSRRSLLHGAVIGAGALAAMPFINACGVSASPSPSAGGKGGYRKFSGPTAWHQGVPAGIAFKQMSAGAEAAAKAFGLAFKEISYNGNNDLELSQMDQMGVQGYTAVSTLILDNGITRSLAEAAVRNKLYLHTWAQTGQWVFPSDPNIKYHYQGLANPPDGAYALCKAMFEAKDGKGTFCHISGAPGSATSLAKDKAVDRALSEFPGIKMVARQPGNYDRETSRSVLATVLAANGGKIDIVYCQSDDSGTGALDALREAGLVGKTLVAGADGIPEFIDAIIAGKAFGTEGAAPYFGCGWGLVKGLDVFAGYEPNPGYQLVMQDLLIIDNKKSAQAYKDTVLTRGPKIFDYKKMSATVSGADWDPQFPILTFDPDQFWTKNQGVAKPNGFELPEDYVKAVGVGRSQLDKELLGHLKDFRLQEVADASLTGKTLFEQLGLR